MPSARANWLPPLAGWLTAIAGLLNVASALTPNLAARARLLLHIEDAEFVPIAHALALSAGVALLVLAVYLGRRRRRALQLAVAILLVAGALNLIKGLDVEEAALNWALAAFLLWGRAAFYVRHEMRLGESLRAAPFLVALAFAGGLAAVFAASGSITPRFGLATAADEVYRLLLLTSGPLHFHGHFRWVPSAVGILSVATLSTIAWSLFRPLAAPLRRTEAARRAAVDLVRRHGHDTLGFFKLRGDKQYLFTDDGTAFVGYRVENGVLLWPVTPSARADAFPALLASCARSPTARGPQARARSAPASGRCPLYEAPRAAHLYLGDEAIVETAGSRSRAAPIRKVRQSVTRIEKAGYTPRCRARRARRRDDGRARARLERRREGAPERGFSMAMDSLGGAHSTRRSSCSPATSGARPRLPPLRAVLRPRRRCRCRSCGATRHARTGSPSSSWRGRSSCSASAGSRRCRSTSPRSRGCCTSPRTPLERALGRVLALGNPYFQIESLYRFNAKFFPRWEPRYLVYEGALGLPAPGSPRCGPRASCRSRARGEGALAAWPARVRW